MSVTRKVGPYHVGPTIGLGGFSKVKIGIHEETGEKVALKIMKKAQFDKLNDQTRRQVERELTAMQKIQHPNVIQLRGVEWDISYPKSNGKFYPAIVVVLELATGGEFFEFLSFTGCFEESIARTYFHQLIEGVGYCHSQGIVHRDLKPENLLLDNKFVLKLADFGFSNQVPDDVLMYTECGTPGYMSPEMIRNQGYDAAKCDIWACGIILFIMLSGFPPLQSPSLKDWWFHKLATNKHALFWQAHSRNAYFSEPLKDLINKILQPDPSRRITVEEIQRHPWFEGPTISDEALEEELGRRKNEVDSRKQAEENEAKRLKMVAMHGSDTNAMDESVDRDIPLCPPSMTMVYEPPVAKSLDIDSSFTDPSGLDSMIGGGGGGFGDDLGSLDLGDMKLQDMPEPQLVDTDLACYTAFESQSTPVELVNRLSGIFDGFQGGYSVKNAIYKLKAKTLSQKGSVSLSAQVFQHQSKKDTYIVQFRRLSGDSVDFRTIYTTIWSQCSDLIKQVE